MKNSQLSLAGLFVALGLFCLGAFIYCAISNYQNSSRTVAVRGLAEREVAADKVLWPVVYTQTGNDLQQIYNTLEKNNRIVTAFLTDAGINPKDIIVNSALVNDLEADRYSSNERGFRYLATQVITVNSSDVDIVVALQLKQNELLRKGIALSNDQYQYRTSFVFTGLNDIKPEMIAEATKAAKESAEQFAADSGVEVGAMRSASQGQFSISDRDDYTPQIKHVRVVTYVNYELN